MYSTKKQIANYECAVEKHGKGAENALLSFLDSLKSCQHKITFFCK